MPPRLPHQIGPKLSAPQHLEHVAAIFDQLLWTRFVVHGSTVIFKIVDDALSTHLLMLRSPENALRNKWCV
jgi:hypothetical protein